MFGKKICEEIIVQVAFLEEERYKENFDEKKTNFFEMIKNFIGYAFGHKKFLHVEIQISKRYKNSNSYIAYTYFAIDKGIQRQQRTFVKNGDIRNDYQWYKINCSKTQAERISSFLENSIGKKYYYWTWLTKLLCGYSIMNTKDLYSCSGLVAAALIEGGVISENDINIYGSTPYELYTVLDQNKLLSFTSAKSSNPNNFYSIKISDTKVVNRNNNTNNNEGSYDPLLKKEEYDEESGIFTI